MSKVVKEIKELIQFYRDRKQKGGRERGGGGRKEER